MVLRVSPTLVFFALLGNCTKKPSAPDNAATILAGGTGDEGGAPAVSGATGTLGSLEIAPKNATLDIDGEAGHQAYTVYLVKDDGTKEDITDKASFQLFDDNVGFFRENTFNSRANIGGTTTLRALFNDLHVDTGITVILHRAITATGAQNADLTPAIAQRFAGDGSANIPAPDIVYPNDGTLVPRNLGVLEFHFVPQAGTDVYELAFTSAYSSIKVYTRCVPLAEGCIYTPDTDAWQWLSDTNHGRSVEVAVRAAATNGVGHSAASTIQLSFSDTELFGGLYYWTTTEMAIKRIDFGSPDVVPETFLSTNYSGGACIGCHALSRDGRKMVVERGGENNGAILLVDVESAMPMTPLTADAQSTFESWSPDASQFAGVYGDINATDFNILLFSGTGATKIDSIPNTGTSAHPADHPDWSADGQRIAYTRVGAKNTLQSFGLGSIQMVEKNGNAWSSPIELVAQAPGKNHYYPAFSPTNDFLVYNESTCPSTTASPDAAGEYANGGAFVDCNADSDPTATLLALLAQAGAQPVPLTRANAPGKRDAGAAALTNSYPKWSPFVIKRTTEPGSRVLWLTFSSRRQYGLRAPLSGQSTWIWMVAVDPDKILRGEDGSYAAFALPYQNFATSNHIAQWVEDILGY